MPLVQPTQNSNVIAAKVEERESLEQLSAILAASLDHLALVNDAGGRVDLPASVAHALIQTVNSLRERCAVMIVPVTRQLTTNQAAQILDISRPHLIQMLERGDIPYSWTGSHRRIALEDLLAYQHDRRAETDTNLTLLTQISQEFGLYDQDYRE